jgi:hypothetical protein
LAARGDAPSAREPGQPENKPARALGPPESAAAPARTPQPEERRRVEAQLASQLATGTRLRSRLEQGSSDGTPNGTGHWGLQIDGWIDETRALLDDTTPALADYFATDTHDTAQTNWPSKLEDAIAMSQAGRLNRHLDRLTEILSRGGAGS